MIEASISIFVMLVTLAIVTLLILWYDERVERKMKPLLDILEKIEDENL